MIDRWKKTILLLLLPFTISAQVINTVAGTGTSGHTGDGGAATAAQIKSPFGLVFDSSGNCYFVETVGNRIRKISPNGIITTVAGIGGGGFSGDGGPATAAQFNNLVGVTVDAIGNLYVADGWNNRIRKIDANTNIVTTIAGTGTQGYNGDGGPATAAMLSDPFDLCFDRFDNLYIADWGNNCIRKINATGIITTIAGTGSPGFSGDGGPATAAEMQGIFGVCLDGVGNLYLADRTNSRIRKVTTTGIITTIAGTGLGYSTGDGGPATAAQLNPERLKFDLLGNLYVSSRYKHSIRKIDAAGIITTVAGDTIGGYSGDNGAAMTAKFNSTIGIDFDSCGNLYVSDQLNNRIRKIDFNPHCWPVGVEEVRAKSIYIYPNPATNDLHIDGARHEQRYKVYDIVGSVMLQGELQPGSNIVSIRSLPVGMYVVEVNDDAGYRTVTRVMKQ